MPKYLTPDEARLPEESLDQRTDEFEHESWTLERPPHKARIPEGTHNAEILKMHRAQKPNWEHPEILEDKVVVLFGTEYGTIQHTMNEKYHPKSTLGKLLTAVLGEIPTSINSNDLVGKKLRITIIHTEKGPDVWENIAKDGFKRPKA